MFNYIKKYTSLLMVLLICFVTSFVYYEIFKIGFVKFNGSTIVIDAGHGGNDPGKVGTGCLEKDINLAIGLKLKKNLEENNVES